MRNFVCFLAVVCVSLWSLHLHEVLLWLWGTGLYFCGHFASVCKKFVSFHFTLLSAVIWLHYTENKPLLSESSEAGRNTGGQWNCASPRFFISNYFITPVFTKYWYFLPICNHSKMMRCSMMLILGENNLKSWFSLHCSLMFSWVARLVKRGFAGSQKVANQLY